MPKPITDHSDQELINLVDNHRRHGRTSEPYFLAALEERARRTGRGLSFQKSFELIRAAAAGGRFLSYKQLAEGSGVELSKARHAMTSHLRALIEYAHGRGWPLISAIVVNQKHLDTGEMEPATLKGFATAARALGFAVVDEAEFLRAQQQAVFEWGRSRGVSS